MARGRVVLVTCLAALGACAKSGEPDAGTERGPCYGNHSCNEGLLCLSDRCVRPPPASCPDVAEALVSIELGNYAPKPERAPRVAELAAKCREQHVTKDEGACLLAARSIAEATFCPKPLLAAPRAPMTGGLPAECIDYAIVLERYAQCTSLDESARASLRQALTQMRQSWAGLGSGAMTPAVAQACAQGRAAIVQGMQQMACP